MDFSVDGFFRTGDQTTLPDGTSAYVRILSDIELKSLQGHSLSIVADMADRFGDKNTEEYKSHIAPLRYAPDDNLIKIMVDSWQTEWIREARDDNHTLFFSYPDNASDQEKIDIDKKQRQHERDVFDAISKYVRGRETGFREKAQGWDRDVLVKNALARAVSLYARDRGLQEEIYHTIWYSIEDGGTHRHFPTVADIKRLPSSVIDRLFYMYRVVDSVDLWTLTKASRHGMLSGWVHNVQLGNASVSSLTSERWPWHWTMALSLESRWEQIAQLGSLSEDGEPPPPEIWHDGELVDKWIDDCKAERKKKLDQN